MGASQRKDYIGTTSALRILLNGVQAGDTVTINGLIYTGVAGVKADDTQFSVDTSDAAAATDLADSIDDDVRVGTVPATIIATSSGTVITVSSDKIVSAESSDGDTINLSGSESTLLALASNVPDNNETVKRIHFMNTPFSPQATGNDKWNELVSDDKGILEVKDEATFNTIVARNKVIFGNRVGYIKSIVASTSLVYAYRDKNNNEITTSKTMAEVIASGSMFILLERY